ncbi:hypothetical protein EAO75_15405 [Streptomyces sp. uw30]|uniref:hypothetical protein n=1 Tax=Streptomyces sp. uw30 TaxID=1828179 RepID=UPI0011CDE201|nr:hypothetical protein [Streptomyces sp. uw30]TXS48352.1 hypothetical protein EAO75_15405 [Streptomyces sp. uw30]
MTIPRPDAAPDVPDACLHFHALFLDTQLDVFLSPGLGRRVRAALARLVTGRGNGRAADGTPDAPERIPEEKGAAR